MYVRRKKSQKFLFRNAKLRIETLFHLQFDYEKASLLIENQFKTGVPRYSRGLRSQDIPNYKRHFFVDIFLWFYGNLIKSLRILDWKAADNKFLGSKRYPRIIKTANSKPVDNEGRLYKKKSLQQHPRHEVREISLDEKFRCHFYQHNTSRFFEQRLYLQFFFDN